MSKRVLALALALGLGLGLALALALAVVAPAVMGIGDRSSTVAAVALSDNRGSLICSDDFIAPPGSLPCMDLKDDKFAANQQIYLYSSTQGKGLGWNVDELGKVGETTPFTNTTLDSKYEGAPIVYLEKTTAKGHNGCIGYNNDAASPDYASLVWEPCGADFTRWVWDNVKGGNDYLINVHRTNAFPRSTKAEIAITCAISTTGWQNGNKIWVGPQSDLGDQGGQICGGTWSVE